MKTISTKQHILENLTPANTTQAEEALAFINLLEFPTRKDEDWKYTRVNKIIKQSYKQKLETTGIDISSYEKNLFKAHNIFVINGVFSEKYSSPIQGVTIEAISEETEHYNSLANNQGEVFTAINTAYNSGGVSIRIHKNELVQLPIHIINIITEDNIIANNRTLIVAEPFSKSKIVQTFITKEAKNTFTNSVTELVVKDNSSIELSIIENEKKNSSIILTTQALQLKNSTLKINTVTSRQDFVRNGINVEVKEENCSTFLNGVFTPNSKEHIDNHTRVDHIAPNCMSSEIYKGVLYDNSTAVFNGKVIVHQDAQKIEAYQKNNNVLLSDNATMNAKPELEIYADDVKCSHGTTTGQFDNEAVFYLQTRGISEQTAKQMLVDAFTDEVFDEFEDENIVEYIKTFIY